MTAARSLVYVVAPLVSVADLALAGVVLFAALQAVALQEAAAAVLPPDPLHHTEATTHERAHLHD